MKQKDPLFLRRLVMTLAGVLIASTAVGFFKASVMGVDPFQALANGTHMKFAGFMEYGTFYIIINLMFLVVSLVCDRHYIGIATFINLFLTGYVVTFSENTIAYFCPEPDLLQRSIFLLIGVVVICFASAFYITADLGVSTYDAVSLIMADRKVASFPVCRIICDVICVVVGFACGAVIGLGTLITAFFMGPLIAFFKKHVSEPLLYGKAKS